MAPSSLPTIYAHLAPDGRLLDARTEAPVSWETSGGKVYEYGARVGWQWSDGPGFELPREGEMVACKVLGEAGSDPQKPVYLAMYWGEGYYQLSRTWDRWAWKYLEP